MNFAGKTPRKKSFFKEFTTMSKRDKVDDKVISAISLRLKQLRLKAGLTQAGIALKIGVSQQTYSNYESKCLSIDVGTLLRLCDFYKVSADYILGKIEIENYPPLPNPYVVAQQPQPYGYGYGYVNEEAEKNKKLFESFMALVNANK